MIRFYDVDGRYIQYLKTIDKQIPDVSYKTNNKFVCGIVLNINDINYYAPISSNTEIQRTNLPILDKQNKVIATIRFCFMFPANMSVLTEKNFRVINETDTKYADLLKTEYNYCISNESRIIQKANSVYEIGCNKNHKFNYTCCDFKLLEQKFNNFEAIALVHPIITIGVDDAEKQIS